MQELIVFGAGKIAECVASCFERSGEFQIQAFCCDREHLDSELFLGRPLVAFEEIERHYSPQRYPMFVALGYQGVNRLRRARYEEAKRKGYRLVNYVGPQAAGNFCVGENSVVMDGAVVQPFAELGNDVFVWGGAMIGHHARIGDHCWITGSASLGGAAEVGEGCFIGLHATVGQEVRVGKGCLLGANTLATHNVPDDSVLVVRDTPPHRLSTSQFLRLSSCF